MRWCVGGPGGRPPPLLVAVSRSVCLQWLLSAGYETSHGVASPAASAKGGAAAAWQRRARETILPPRLHLTAPRTLW